MMMSTVFTKIIQREIPAEIVYEDEHFIAFLDIIQTTKGHCLVVTKKEYVSVLALPENVASEFFKVVNKVAKAITKAFNTDSINILSNSGVAAGQTIYHCHFHLIPRYKNDGLNFSLINHIHETTQEEYVLRKEAIIKALNNL